MLSYRHAFHAGNFADLLKHWVQVEILNYLKQKDKAFVYIDTHAGAGLYSLCSNEAAKNAEYQTGIGAFRHSTLAALQDYLTVVNALAERDGAVDLYPGSPAIAQHMLRATDRAELFELHPSDYALLQQLVKSDARIKTHNTDSFLGLLSLLPPKERRGLILIDPPYEIKSDYETVVDVLIKAHKKFATGIYALWYPVVDRQRIDRLEEKLIGSGIKNIQLFELGLRPDTTERGMTSAGMIVINPPWTLAQRIAEGMPAVAAELSAQAVWRIETLVAQ